jgi:hypothetical protein
MGDCRFPRNKEVREKYPHPVCEIGDSSEEEQRQTQEAIEDIENILKKSNAVNR